MENHRECVRSTFSFGIIPFWHTSPKYRVYYVEITVQSDHVTCESLLQRAVPIAGLHSCPAIVSVKPTEYFATKIFVAVSENQTIWGGGGEMKVVGNCLKYLETLKPLF